MKKIDNNLLPFYKADCIEAGCDEAGRGCLAGPVFAADFECPHLNDSKQLTEKQRQNIRLVIEKNALAWAVARIDAEEIDNINILKASILCMHKALDNLSIIPEHIYYRRKQIYSIQRCRIQNYRKGRRQISVDSRSIGISKDS